jgi:hypothetical protein
VALRGSRLIGSLVVGLVFAFITWVMIGNNAYGRPTGIAFEYLGEVIMILLLPGLFAAVMVSGNIHIGSTWIVVLGNFIFYFGAVYLVLANREKRKSKRRTALGGET